MICRGKVRDGVVLLDHADALPNGAEVRVVLVRREKRTRRKGSLAARLRAWAGKAKGLPSDYARNHDHYLHGLPKR